MGVCIRAGKDGKQEPQTVDITHILKANHHHFAEILNRVEAARKVKELDSE